MTYLLSRAYFNLLSIRGFERILCLSVLCCQILVILKGEVESGWVRDCLLILRLGIRPCASQIYPYVTKKLRVPGGYQLGEMHSSALPVPTSGISYFFMRCFDLICLCWFDRSPRVSEFSAVMWEARHAACVHAELQYPFALLLLLIPPAK